MPLELPSRKELEKAAGILRKEDGGTDYEYAVGVVARWRSAHFFPVNEYHARIRSKLKGLGFKRPLAAQRLKRMPSIIGKLRRFGEMSLARMQDIGGIRVILKDMSEVRMFHSILCKKGMPPETVLLSKDYIQEPKKDGYRSIHQVFRYVNATHPELDGLRIEVQIRTELQHSWATAVETLGVIEKQSFKTGEGGEDFKYFFKLASALFAIYEKQPVIAELSEKSDEEIAAEFCELEKRLNVYSKLTSLAVSDWHIESVESKKSTAYQVLELDSEKGTLSVVQFTKNQQGQAEDFYKIRESAAKQNPGLDVVMVSVGALKEVKKAYPNYFLNNALFVKNAKRICANILGKE
jgi:hypothetical protein